MTFEPLPPLRRNVRTPREQPRQWPLVLGTASMVVLCVSVLMLRASAPARVVRVAPSPPPPPPVALPPAPVVAVTEPADPPQAVRGTVDASLVPPSMRETLTDAQAAELLTVVNEWLAAEDSYGGPSIEYRRGVVHVESEEDRGDDPPYPLNAAAEAERVCGSAATWLRAYLHERLRHTELTCAGNVCGYPGAEYSPVGLVVFHHGEGDDEAAWSIAAWAQYDVAALAPAIADANADHVRTSLRRLAGTRCRGEPNRHD